MTIYIFHILFGEKTVHLFLVKAAFFVIDGDLRYCPFINSRVFHSVDYVIRHNEHKIAAVDHKTFARRRNAVKGYGKGVGHPL